MTCENAYPDRGRKGLRPDSVHSGREGGVFPARMPGLLLESELIGYARAAQRARAVDWWADYQGRVDAFEAERAMQVRQIVDLFGAPPLIVNGPDPRSRIRARLREGRPDWYSIKAVARTADVYVYDEIGYFGVTAQQFASEVAALDVDTINLRINSPGGEVFDGIAIHNVLVNHPAVVNVVVDGLAASIASVIAMAGDTITMGEGSRMMIHPAQGLVLGDAAEFRAMADLLDTESASIAGFYARRAGGTQAQWLATMSANGVMGTWYTAEEAVSAGLATAVGKPPARPADVPNNSWDLSLLGLRKPGLQPAQPTNVAPPAAPAPVEPVIEVTQLPEPVEPDEFELAIGRAFANLDLGDMLTEVVHDQSRNMPAPDPDEPEGEEEESSEVPDFVIDPIDIINGLHAAGWRAT